MITGDEPIIPVLVPGHTYKDGSSDPPYFSNPGLTIRQLFSVIAMQGLLSNSVELEKHKSHGYLLFEPLAIRARQAADALIAELNKSPQP